MMTARCNGFFFLALLSAALLGCSSQSEKTTQPAEPRTQSQTAAKPKAEADQLKAGREALQVMYASARVWSGDAQPASLSSNPREGDTAGRAASWSASFVSVSKKSIRNFSWSGAAGDESGVSLGSIDRYSPENASTQPFDMNFLKIDSNEAFETAQKHGGATILKKAPDTLMQYQLLWEPRKPRLSWSIKYAPSGSGAKLDAIVNASTGQFQYLAK